MTELKSILAAFCLGCCQAVDCWGCCCYCAVIADIKQWSTGELSHYPTCHVHLEIGKKKSFLLGVFPLYFITLSLALLFFHLLFTLKAAASVKTHLAKLWMNSMLPCVTLNTIVYCSTVFAYRVYGCVLYVRSCSTLHTCKYYKFIEEDMEKNGISFY